MSKGAEMLSDKELAILRRWGDKPPLVAIAELEAKLADAEATQARALQLAQELAVEHAATVRRLEAERDSLRAELAAARAALATPAAEPKGAAE